MARKAYNSKEKKKMSKTKARHHWNIPTIADNK